MPRRKNRDFDRQLGGLLRKKRASLGSDMTMKRVIEEAGLDIVEATMWGIEKGEQQISVHQLFKLTPVLKLDINAMFELLKKHPSTSIEFIPSDKKGKKQTF